MFARCAGHGAATETPIGLIPPVGGEGIDTRGLDVSEEDMAELLRVETEEWRAQLPQFREHLAKFDRLPAELNAQLRRARGALGCLATLTSCVRAWLRSRRPLPAGVTPRPAR